ncbi:MAG TPA: hypothetical protein VFJ82_23250 [Longimicrobium sp.]|nr:hypothetical protein [Longimicrobium sp.]
MKRILSFVRRWWKRHPMLHPLVAGALVLAVQPATRGRATRFAELAPGEHVVVHYTLHNCGGLTRARITFTGTRAGVRYTATARGAGFRTHTRSGELSRGDAARLDRGIDRFRATRRERCSVEQRVEVTRT